MKKILGIDLGTTNSCAAVYEKGDSHIIINKEGKQTTPSVVAFTDKGEILVGESAKRQMITNPKKTIYSIKRIMGLMCNEEKAKEAKKRLPYEVVDRNGACAVNIDGKVYTPQEISAKILMKIKTDAEASLGQTITDAVITVPAYFNDAQRKATKEAGAIAGLNVLRIINEPTSAALAYGLDKKDAEKIAVYDLGGGTFDVTILETGDNVVEVLSTGGDAFLGGDDFDNRLTEYIVENFKAKEGIDISKDIMAVQRLKDAAEAAKKELSSAQETEINLPFITADATGPKHLVEKITRSKFESLIEDLVEKTIKTIKEVVKDSGLSKENIQEVVLVGGSTRIPLVQKKVKEFFNKEPNKTVNPDEVVAIGAAIQGAIIEGDINDVLLLDVTPLSLGLETQGGIMTKIIEKGSTIPTKKTETFSTAEDNQPAVTIHVLQGERELAKDNKSLGQFNLEGIPPAPRGIPQIEVTFDIDANGILTVNAVDKASGKQQEIRITGSSGLSQEEIDKMIEEAKMHKSEDEKRRAIIEAKNKLEALLYEAEKNENKTEELLLKINTAKETLNIDDLQAIESIIVDLSNALVAEKNKTSEDKASNSKKNDKEDVIDAEVE